MSTTQPEALQDFEVRKLAAIGAVSTSSGLVERRPIEYRRELEDQFVRGFRAAEKRLAALVDAQQPAPSAAPAVSDEDEALDLLAALFDAWENGTPCYEEPESSDGFLGHAFSLDDEVFHRCADLLNRRRGKQPSPTPQADSQPAPDERDDFEKVFPLPSGCIRVGTGYASTGYSNWAAHTHCERWQGWQARAARGQAPAGWTDADADAARLALELECLLMDTKDAAVVSKWWASANDALEMHRMRLAIFRAAAAIGEQMP